MRKEMIKHGIAIIGVAILVFFFFSSASAPKYEEVPPDKLGRGQEIPFKKIVTETKLKFLRIFGYGGHMVELVDAKNVALISFREELLEERIEANKVYRIYITCADGVLSIDRIDGLMSVEEAQAKIEQKSAEKIAKETAEKAEREAAEEARQRAREEANRYDPSKFTVVPSDFKPADYTKVDLFKAASNARDLQISSNKYDALNRQLQSAFALGLGGTYILEYVSDVTFVRQNGTDITFSSDDNAITQNMSIDQRSGLQAGQKVRIYYTIMRSPLTTWDVTAIERR
jgi:hypothetical protein